MPTDLLIFVLESNFLIIESIYFAVNKLANNSSKIQPVVTKSLLWVRPASVLPMDRQSNWSYCTGHAMMTHHIFVKCAVRLTQKLAMHAAWLTDRSINMQPVCYLGEAVYQVVCGLVGDVWQEPVHQGPVPLQLTLYCLSAITYS